MARDSAKTVTESFVRLGRNGWIDYTAGAILFLMVIKKSLNGYLIIEWLHSHRDIDSDGTNANIVGMCLLVCHFVVTLYVMMVPKLAHSQRANYRRDTGWICCKGTAVRAGIFLLTIALVDWMSVLINTLSLINLIRIQTDAEVSSLASNLDLDANENCEHPDAVRIVAIFAMAGFVLRVLGQLVVFLYLRNQNGPLQRPQSGGQQAPGADRFRDTTLTGVDQGDQESCDEWKRRWDHPWRKWRDLFQMLSFNSWLMVPALLFVEKPYHWNLLKRDRTSPFRRRHPAIGLIFGIMFVKKTCVFLVNAYALTEGCLDQLQASEKSYSKWLAGLALAATTVHTGIWFCTFFFLWVPCCKEDDEEESSSGESSDEEDAYLRSGRRSSRGEQMAGSVESNGGTAMRGVGTGQDPGDSLRKRRDPELEPEPEPQAGVSRPASPGLLAGAE
eukprot:COSAG04_NODE_367_length_15823_cov_6.139977_7_plen_445_part_00